jgi:hypothetical protein
VCHPTPSLPREQDFVDIEGEEGIEVSISSEPGLGTVYRWVDMRAVNAFTSIAMPATIV